MHEGRPTAYIFIRPPCLGVRGRPLDHQRDGDRAVEEENDDELKEEERDGRTEDGDS